MSKFIKDTGNSKDLPPGIRQKRINKTETIKPVKEVFSILLVGLAKWKKVVPRAQLIPANIAIHSTNEEGIKMPFSIPTMISRPINPNIIEIILLTPKNFFNKILENNVPQIGAR